MTTDQIMALIRQLLPVVGGLAVAFGWLTPDKVSYFTGIVLQVAGPLLIAGSAIWSVVANTKSSIIASTAAMPEVQGVITTSTPAGSALAAVVPASNVVTAGTGSAATLASSPSVPKTSN